MNACFILRPRTIILRKILHFRKNDKRRLRLQIPQRLNEKRFFLSSSRQIQDVAAQQHEIFCATTGILMKFIRHRAKPERTDKRQQISEQYTERTSDILRRRKFVHVFCEKIVKMLNQSFRVLGTSFYLRIAVCITF